MFNLGMGEITVILLLALIFLGPKKLPELASGLGKLIREIRKTTADVKNEIQLDEAIRKPFEELREAVTLHPDELKRRDKLRKELADIQRQAEAAVAAAEENIAASGSPAAADHDASALVEGAAGSETETGTETETGMETPWSSAEHSNTGSSQAEQTLAQITPPPIPTSPAALPGVPGAAPVGTVARVPFPPASGPVTGHDPPAPPLAAVLAKGSGPVTTPERRPAQPPGGSDFLRSLRAVPEGKVNEGSKPEGRVNEGRVNEGKLPEGLKLDAKRRSRPVNPAAGTSPPDSAADRGNVTQALSEADLAAITVGPPAPPPVPNPARVIPSSPHTAPASPSPPRLPGATPPKNRNQ